VRRDSITGRSPVVNEALRPKFTDIVDVPVKDYIWNKPSPESFIFDRKWQVWIRRILSTAGM
jgi:hypothetical protein